MGIHCAHSGAVENGNPARAQWNAAVESGNPLCAQWSCWGTGIHMSLHKPLQISIEEEPQSPYSAPIESL